MNILIDKLPDTVDINGEDVEVNSDFRACLRTILAFEDEELTGLEKQVILLRNLYKDIPEDIETAIQQGLWFLDGGQTREDEEDRPLPMRLYSFEKDANFIFAAFLQTHGIDLATTNMHWWKFMTLFNDLGSETAFWNLISLRKRIKTGKATREEQEAAREMQDVVELPEYDTRTWEEREQDEEFMRQVREGSYAV